MAEDEQKPQAEVQSADVERVRDELERLKNGEHDALDALLPLLFDNLRRVARAQRHRVGGGETLRTTALIHEAYLKLRRSGTLVAHDEQHFLHIAARAMRQILVDHARSRQAARKRDLQSSLEIDQLQLARQERYLLDIDAALEKLEPLQPRLVQIVNCRYFAGYTQSETADLLGISERTVRREWLKAKAELLQALQGGDHAAI